MPPYSIVNGPLDGFHSFKTGPLGDFLEYGVKKKPYGPKTSRVFANGPGDRGSIPGRVIPKTQKMVRDAALLSPQYYKVGIKGKVEQSREWSSTLPYTSV